MTIDPRILLCQDGARRVFTNQADITCLHQARSAVRCSASRMKGELHPSKNRLKDGLRHLMPTFLRMDNSTNELLCFLVWPLQRQQSLLLCNCLVGALSYSHYVMRSFPLCGVTVLPPGQYDLLDNHPGNRQEKKKKLPWLSRLRSDWHVFCFVFVEGVSWSMRDNKFENACCAGRAMVPARRAR